MSKAFTGLRPRTEKLDHFCRQVALHHNKALAAREAGYSQSWIKAKMSRHFREYTPYIAHLQEQQSIAIAKVTAITQQSVLDELAKVAFANPKDYIERIPDSTDEAPRYRFKDFGGLTRDQAAAIGNIQIDDKGVLRFNLARKTPELLALAKAVGLASEKLIVQHNHAHLHAKLDLSSVPSSVLEDVEKLLSGAGAKVYENGEGKQG
jgi:hypothetical protein